MVYQSLYIINSRQLPSIILSNTGKLKRAGLQTVRNASKCFYDKTIVKKSKAYPLQSCPRVKADVLGLTVHSAINASPDAHL